MVNVRLTDIEDRCVIAGKDFSQCVCHAGMVGTGYRYQYKLCRCRSCSGNLSHLCGMLSNNACKFKQNLLILQENEQLYVGFDLLEGKFKVGIQIDT